MVNACTVVHILVDCLNPYRSLLRLQDIFLVALSKLLSKLALYHEWEGIRHLMSASENTSHEGWASNLDGVNRAEASLLETIFDERRNIELQVQPDSFEDLR